MVVNSKNHCGHCCLVLVHPAFLAAAAWLESDASRVASGLSAWAHHPMSPPTNLQVNVLFLALARLPCRHHIMQDLRESMAARYRWHRCLVDVKREERDEILAVDATIFLEVPHLETCVFFTRGPPPDPPLPRQTIQTRDARSSKQPTGRSEIRGRRSGTRSTLQIN